MATSTSTLPGAERAQRLLAGALAQVAVHGGGREPALGEVVGDALHGALGPGEDHGEAAALGLQYAGEQLDLVHGVRAVDQLRGALVDGALVGLLGADVRRPGQERAGQRDDRAGHGGREQHRLPLLGQHPHDALDVGQEAEVQHLVGLVEDQRLDAAEHEVALLGEVQQAAGRADHDVDALAQRGELRLVGAAAVDRGDPDAELGAGVGEVLGDLHAQLAGGHHDQRLRDVLVRSAASPSALAAGCSAGGVTPLQQRHAEAERLAHAGAGLADDVLAGQRERQRELLDGERALDAGFGQRGHDLGADAELGEGGGVRPDGGPGLQGVRLLGAVGGGAVDDVGGVGGLDGQDDRLSPRTGAGPARRPPATVARRESRRGAARTRSIGASG